MSRLAVRIPFVAAGPFVALKPGTVGGVAVEHGEVIAAKRIEHIGERKLRLMFDGRWIDMASPEQIVTAALIAAGYSDPVATLADEASRDALARAGAPVEPAPPAQNRELVVFEIGDGDILNGTNRLPAMVLVGENEMQLGRIVTSAFRANEMSVADWNGLSDEYRDTLVLDRARAIGWAGEPLPAPAPAGEPATPPAPPAPAPAPEAPPAAPAPAPAKPAGNPVAVGVMHAGFGRWYTVDADGAQFGKALRKPQADALNLPVIEKKPDHGDGG